MRRFLFFLAPAGLAAFAFACEDDPTSNASVNFPEAGTVDSSRDPSDSSTPDALPDSGPPSPKGVTVVVTGRSGPKSGITVVFHDAAGAVLETKQTGADGKATSTPVPTPAMATAVLGGELSRQLLTWTGTEDGDELPAVVPEPGTLAELQITVPGEADGGVTYYASVGGCRTSSTIANEPITLFVENYCFRGAGALLVEAADDSDFALAHTFKKPLAIPTDAGVAVVNGLPAYTFNPTSVSVQVNGPANILEGAFVRLHEVANNTYFASRDQGFAGSTASATTYERTFKIAPATFTEAINVSAAFEGANTRIIGKRAPVAATVTLDANALPPEITGSSYDQTNPKRPIAKWTGTMTGMRGGVIRLRFFDSQNEKATAWSIVVPATGNAVTAPALPASVDDLLPVPDSGVAWEGSPEIIFADSSLLVSGYATFRKVQGVVLPALDNDATVDDTVLPNNGDFKITRYPQLIGF
jgi:hypothetical protein